VAGRRADRPGRLTLPEGLEGTLFVLGKGGVGKTVISEGLAAFAAETGRSTLLVRLGETLEAGTPPAHSPRPSRHGFDVVDLDARAAMDEYVRHTVRLRALAERITKSEIYRKFFAAAPGLPELVLLGRIREYAFETARGGVPRFQTVVVDCPSSGHGLLMLETPFAAFRAVPVGPFARLASQITDWLQTGVNIAVVAVPEEMAVVEAIEFKDDLLEGTGIAPALAFLNRVRRETLSAGARRAVAEGEASPGTVDRLLLDCGAHVLRKARLEAFHERRLEKGLSLRPILIGELLNCRPATVAAALAGGEA
jgi:hypothetical protein